MNSSARQVQCHRSVRIEVVFAREIMRIKWFSLISLVSKKILTLLITRLLVRRYLDSFTLRVNSIYISIEVSLVSTRQKLNQTVLAYLNTIGVQIGTSTLQKH